MRKLLSILLLSIVVLSVSGKNKERITERGSSLFYRSWRYPISEDLEKDTLQQPTEVTDTLIAEIEEVITEEKEAPAIEPEQSTTAGSTHKDVAQEEKENTSDNGSLATGEDAIDKCILYFVFDQDNYIANYEAEIDTLLQFIHYHKGKEFEIVGHTDERGTIAYNQLLSERRANKVKASLVQRGIEASRLHTIGRSELEPVVPNAKDEREHQLNRRVEVRIKK